MAKSESDYRRILGVSDSATPEQIKRAYRRLAMRFHPDLNKGKEATQKFKEIREAYAVLSGKEKAPKTPEPRRESEAIFRHGRDPVPYEVAEWNLSVRRAWDDMENQTHNNAYR